MSRDYNAPEPSGNSAESVFHKATWRKVHGQSGRLNSTSSVSVHRTTKGDFLTVKKRSGGAPTTVQVSRLSIKSIFDNYFVCLDSTGATFRVAKCPELQNSVTARTYYGTVWLYGYPRNSTVNTYRYILRVASATTPAGLAITETQLICEPYVVGTTFGAGTMLFAIKTPTGVATIAADTGATVGTSVDYQDMNVSGHAWGRAANQNPT